MPSPVPKHLLSLIASSNVLCYAPSSLLLVVGQEASYQHRNCDLLLLLHCLEEYQTSTCFVTATTIWLCFLWHSAESESRLRGINF